MLKTVILKRSILFFSAGCRVAIQQEDGGPWTHEIIEEANGSNYREQLYIIQVMKTGKLITWNMKHICNNPVTTEQYLHEQI